MDEEGSNSEVFFNREDRFTSSNVGQVAKSGDSELLKELLQKGYLSDVCDNRGWFPIHEASNSGHTSCVEILLQLCKRDFKDTKAYNGETPLFLAALHGHDKVMRILLHHGADASISNNELVSVLVAAVKGRNKECVQICIDRKVDLDSQDAGGWSALHEAAFLGEEDFLKLLISAGANVAIRNSDGATPLFIAAQYGHRDCLNILIKNEGKVNLGTNDNATAVFIASQEGHVDCVKALIDADADVRQSTTDFATPLHAAAERGNLECIRLLIKAGADVNAKCIEGRNLTPLHMAVTEDNVECVVELIESGACVTAELQKGNETPLEVAASFGSVRCCEELIKRGCDPNRSFRNDSLEETTLSCAIDAEESGCLEVLLKHGADPNKEYYSYPIIAAAKNFNPECLSILLKYGADVNLQDKAKNTALNLSVTRHNHHLASHKSEETKLECIRILLKAGADLEVLFKHPHGVFHVSVTPLTPKFFPRDLIKLLLLFGADGLKLKKLMTCHHYHRDFNWNDLIVQCEMPRKLVNLCRLAIRKTLGRNRIIHISELPIPVILQQFLAFKDL